MEIEQRREASRAALTRQDEAQGAATAPFGHRFAQGGAGAAARGRAGLLL